MVILFGRYYAPVETFFSSLKKERTRKRIYKTRDLSRADIFDYIEVFCNEPDVIAISVMSVPRRLNVAQCEAGNCLLYRRQSAFEPSVLRL